MTKEEAIKIIRKMLAYTDLTVRANLNADMVSACNLAIEILEQEPRWILVNERLPEPNARDGLIARYYLIQNEYGDMLVARYDGKGWEQMYQHKYLEDEVVAWMPLPKIYSEVKE